MRILQVLPEMNVGGVETGTVDLARYLVDHGHGAVVVSNGGRLVRDLEQAGARHYALPVHKKNLWTAVKGIRRLRAIITDENIDIVHARSRVPAWIAYFACRHTQAQFITTCHGHYAKHFFSRVMGWAKRVIVPSEAIGRHMIDNFGVAAEAVRCIPRSVDLDRFQVTREEPPGRSHFTVAMVGRITPLKGHTYFLKAMAKVVRSMPYVKVWIIGDAPAKKPMYRQELEVLTRHLGLSENVEFLGSRRDVPQLLAQTDALVMSSVVPEAFGRVILEAQAVGIPVVATAVGGVTDIIDDGRTGLLVLPKDVDAMAAAVLRVLRDKKLAKDMVDAARQKLADKFTLAHMAEKTIAVYQELLESLHILVIKISAVGDVILATPSLRVLRRKYPKAKIHCLVGEESRPVLQRCPHVDGIIVIDPKDRDRGFWRLLKFSGKLRSYRFDKVVDLQNNRISHWLAFLSWPRESYGYNNGKWGFLLTDPVKDTKEPLGPVAHQFRVLAQLGISYRQDLAPEMWPSAQDHHRAQQLLESEWLGGGHIRMVGINIAASAKWPTKNWPPDYIARLCDLLAAENVRVVITGMAKDKARMQQVLALTKAKPADFVGKTDMMLLAALVKRCQVYLTPDSAPMHVAAAMKTPFIAFFGPTDPARHLPPARKAVVLQQKLDCMPCYGTQCRISTHACMKELTPEIVFEKVKQLLEETH